MAVIDAILVPSQDPAIKVAAIVTTASSAEQLLGKNQLFAIHATDSFHLRFGVTGMGAGVATDFLLPGGQIHVFDTGQAFTHVRVFNDSGGNIDFYIQPLSRF